MNALQKVLKTKGDLVLLGGEILFGEDDATSSYHLLAGEVLILRNGQVIDLVEAGELLDAEIWHGVTAVAWTDCVLQTVKMHPPTSALHTSALHTSALHTDTAAIERHLALAA